MDEIVCVCDGAVAGGWFMMLRGGDGAGGRMGGGEVSENCFALGQICSLVVRFMT